MLCKLMTARAEKLLRTTTKTTELKPASNQNTAKLKIGRNAFLRGNPSYTLFYSQVQTSL